MVNSRYSRQILFPPIGAGGQERLSRARVVIVGCGALGSVAAEQLVRAGVGSLRLVDRDFVEESNLQRQCLFTEEHARLALPKAVAAESVLGSMNSQVRVDGRVDDLTHRNVDRLCAGSHLILDGTDNFETRYLINDFSLRTGRTWIYGACVASYGTAFAFRPGVTPCLQCLFPQAPAPGSAETCDTSGILAPVVHMVASYQVAQALKILVGADPAATILKVDVWENRLKLVSLEGARAPECPCCGSLEFRFLEGRERRHSVRLCGRNAVQVRPGEDLRIDLPRLARRLRPSGKVSLNDYMMKFEVNGYELALFRDGRAIIRGTEEESKARAVYARYVGC
jgi:adenylyltransferase/sulfurtransferase